MIKTLCAPLQGMTDAVWREAHAAIFGGVEAYYGPFLRLEHGTLRNHDLNDVASPLNKHYNFVPQIISCQGEKAIALVNTLRALGYRRIDINLGCPHPPVALHGMGSGLLARPALLDEMVHALAGITDVSFSVKMRLGWDDATQWRAVLPALTALRPVHVTVHPRTGRQQYKGELCMAEFEALLAQATFPVVFNGEIHTRHQLNAIAARYPTLEGVMVGRGLIAHPALMAPEKENAEHHRAFHERLLQGYSQQLTGGEHQLLGKMKALWQYFLPDAPRKARKAVLKARDLEAYRRAATLAIESAVPLSLQAENNFFG